MLDLSHIFIDVILANAIRDLQAVRALDLMAGYEQEEMQHLTSSYLKKTSASNFADVDVFATEKYRRLPPQVIFDAVREMFRAYLPKQISWTKEEKELRPDLYHLGIYMPAVLSPSADRLARTIIPLGGAIFILVPMYIMALHQNSTSNLITTTIAVVLLVVICAALRLPNETIFSATVGYAAVLIVFVGLTSSPPQSSG
jgi:hypothetical protein